MMRSVRQVDALTGHLVPRSVHLPEEHESRDRTPADAGGAPTAFRAPSRSLDVSALYASHAPALRRFCLRLTRDLSAAEDLAQEAFTRFIARLPHLDPEVNTAAYLQTTARNLYVKDLRASRREYADDLIEDRAGSDDDLERDPARALLLGEQIDQVRRSAARLTRRQRRAIMLREVHGRSYAEIAEDLGISCDAVGQTISRARARLRSEYRREQAPAPPDHCAGRREALSAFLDGQLAAGARAELEAHVQSCQACREVLTAYSDAGIQLRAGAPLPLIAAVAARLGLAIGDAANQAICGAATVLGTAIVAAGGFAVAHHASTPAAPASPVATHVGSGHPHSPAVIPAAALPSRPLSSAASMPADQVRPSSDDPAGQTQADTSVSDSAPGATSTDITSLTGAGDTSAEPTGSDPPAHTSGGGVGTPAITTPPVATPHVNVPHVTTPEIDTPVVTVPAVTIPSVDVPAVTVPSVTLPAVKAPDITIGSSAGSGRVHPADSPGAGSP
jgi:RNA polymerase sigma factor (sigma-70 family)